MLGRTGTLPHCSEGRGGARGAVPPRRPNKRRGGKHCTNFRPGLLQHPFAPHAQFLPNKAHYWQKVKFWWARPLSRAKARRRRAPARYRYTHMYVHGFSGRRPGLVAPPRKETLRSGRIDVFARLKRLIRPQNAVLDLGCGPGILARELGRRDIVGAAPPMHQQPQRASAQIPLRSMQACGHVRTHRTGAFARTRTDTAVVPDLPVVGSHAVWQCRSCHHGGLR